MGIGPREGVLLGANLRRAIVTNGDFTAFIRVRQRRDAALFTNYFGQTCYRSYYQQYRQRQQHNNYFYASALHNNKTQLLQPSNSGLVMTTSRGNDRNCHSAAIAQGVYGGRSTPEAEAVCRNCLQTWTAERSKFENFRITHLLILD